uniref:Protein PNS1 n=1 Tax=Nosema pernyi TaxID=1112939 RepID=X5E4K6_9MICR|nr:hypothetical protein NP_c61 [Nosema pernyi]
MDNKSNLISKRRTFKDGWAFILYLMYTIGCSGCLVMFGMETDASLTNVNYKLLAVLSISTLAVIILSFLLFAFLCEFTIKFSAILFPVIQIAMLCFFPTNVVVIVLGVLSILSWASFVYLYWSQIPIIAKVLTYTTRICLSHLFTCVFGIVICNAIQIFQVFLAFLVLPKLDDKNSIFMLAAVFLNLFWTLANFSCFFKVYISSVVAFHFVNSGSGVFGDTMYNTLCALGSISFAGLVIASVQTVRLLVDRARREDREEQNLFTKIMLCILVIFLTLLQDIIEFANEFSMPYIAIHGCGYKESVRESFKLITRINTIALSGVTLLNIALSQFSILMMTITFGLSYYTIGANLKFDFQDKLFLNSLINTIIGVLVVYFTTMSTFISSYLGLIYLNAERPNLVSEVDPRISDTLKKTTASN